MKSLMLPCGVAIFDDFLPDDRRQELDDFLTENTWEWGWKSTRGHSEYRFWHKHFAGQRKSDRRGPHGEVLDPGGDCAEELKAAAPLVWCFWEDVSFLILPGQTLVRCYANGMQYGSDGTVHTDSVVSTSYTSVYYPHEKWDPNWGGETAFFNKDKSDIVASIYPKPGRLVCFPGTVPHVARGVSRLFPGLRVTLMFKTEKPE